MKNGTIWLDDAGIPIQAHGGCLLNHGGTWYWYGEDKGAPNDERKHRVPFIGVRCYSSKDFRSWHDEGLALRATRGDTSNPLDESRVGERPKVIYNERTKKFVLWLHLDDSTYTYARAGVAIADAPAGPFRFLDARLPNRRDTRDMTLFQEADGTAYLIHSGDWNKTLYISELNDDYTDITGVCWGILQDQEREAPAMFKKDGMYYAVTSGCTGWAPNSALYAAAAHVSCGWKLIDNPCTGPDYRRTFGGQSAHIFCVKGQHYLLLDHWKPEKLSESGYSILKVDAEGIFMEIPWSEECPVKL